MLFKGIDLFDFPSSKNLSDIGSIPLHTRKKIPKNDSDDGHNRGYTHRRKHRKPRVQINAETKNDQVYSD